MRAGRTDWMEAIAQGWIPRAKHLAMLLSNLPSSDERKLMLEQYTTPGNLAARWLLDIAHNYSHNWMNREVFDLGAGNGILGLGCALLGARKVVLIDSDPSALDAAKAATQQLREEVNLQANVDFVCEMLNPSSVIPIDKNAIIVMNPPWGTQVKKADRGLLEYAFNSDAEFVHLLHSASVKHPLRMAEDVGWVAKSILEDDFQLPATFLHHRREQMVTRIACWAFSRTDNAEV